MELTTEEYLAKKNNFQGFCTNCMAWTRSGVESDGRGYYCPECKKDEVIGADEALIDDFILIED